MLFLSAFLLSTALNLEILRVSLYYGIKKINVPKSSAIFLAITISIGMFFSMYVGKLILNLFNPQLGNIFGGVLLGFIGVYFLAEYIRLEKEASGYDTSYYLESSLKYKNILENPIVIDSDKSNHIDMRECLNLSVALILNNFFTFFAASLTGISISLSIFFCFIIILFSVYQGSFNSHLYISKWFSKYSNLISGIILIILGIYETFI